MKWPLSISNNKSPVNWCLSCSLSLFAGSDDKSLLVAMVMGGSELTMLQQIQQELVGNVGKGSDTSN